MDIEEIKSLVEKGYKYYLYSFVERKMVRCMSVGYFSFARKTEIDHKNKTITEK